MRKHLDRTELARYVVLELDGLDVSPETVDATTFFELVASFFQLLKANAKELATPLRMTGVRIEDKCVAACALPDNLTVAKECAGLAIGQIGGAEVPRGLGHYVERVRTARSRLPKGQEAKVFVGSWERSLLAPVEQEPPLDSLLSIRATPTRAGGKKPVVRFTSEMEEEDFTLSTTADQARQLGGRLYQEVDIVAHVSRDAHGAIEAGRLEAFELVDDDDPRPAWREWFSQMSRTGTDQ